MISDSVTHGSPVGDKGPWCTAPRWLLSMGKPAPSLACWLPLALELCVNSWNLTLGFFALHVCSSWLFPCKLFSQFLTHFILQWMDPPMQGLSKSVLQNNLANFLFFLFFFFLKIKNFLPYPGASRFPARYVQDADKGWDVVLTAERANRTHAPCCWSSGRMKSW